MKSKEERWDRTCLTTEILWLVPTNETIPTSKWRQQSSSTRYLSLTIIGQCLVLMLQEPGFLRAKKREDLMITQKTNVHTSIHKVYKDKWPYRLLKPKITSILTYSHPYIHKNPSYRPIPTQNSSYPANPTSKTHFSTPKTYPKPSKSS